MTEYHCKESCNRCGADNYWEATEIVDGYVAECKTKCSQCGYIDYWAYGFFESGSEMESKCRKYTVENGVLKSIEDTTTEQDSEEYEK